MINSRIALVALLVTLAHCDRPKPTQEADAPPPSAAPKSDVAAGIHYELRYTGGADPAAKLPMIVAIHGLGDRPEGFGRIFDSFPVQARVVLPRGTTAHGSGFSWFAIDLPVDPAKVSPGVEQAAKNVARMLDALRELHPTAGKPIVTGFSQGGILSLTLATRYPATIAAALPIAGWLPAPLVPSEKPRDAPPIIALHGDADALLPIEQTRESIGALRKLGFTAELREYPGVGHELSPAMQRDLFRELAALAEQARK